MTTTTTNNHLSTVASVAVLTVLVGCSTLASKPDGVNLVRDKLANLQANSQLIALAPLEFKEAEQALLEAERPQGDKVLAKHLLFIADRKIDVAEARAQGRFLVEQREVLSGQSDAARLESRTREVDIARNDAKLARVTAEEMRSSANTEQQRNSELKRQLGVLDAKATDRGMIMTLSDLSFAIGKSELKENVSIQLDRLAAFLAEYQDRNVVIEGHTDNTGNTKNNLVLSQHRANAVRDYLVAKNINPDRLEIFAKGEGSPIDSRWRETV